MSFDTVSYSGPIWRWTGSNGVSWHFITIDGKAGEALSGIALMRKLENGRRAGFGSLKVGVRIGDIDWKTSVFPDKTRGWLLPIKAAIRKAEDIAEGDEVTVTLEV